MTDSATSSRRIPLAVKVAFTAFLAVLVPYYWATYGPTNFLYFCDIALFCTLYSLWTERPLAASAAVVGITIPQLVWQVDFLSTAAGVPLLGMTGYMFDEELSLFARGLSFFHFWLPILLLWMIRRIGYDRRALPVWTAIAWTVIPICYFLLPGPTDPLDFPAQPHNVNYVYGMDGDTAQTLMPPLAWLGLLLIGLPTLVYLPTHLAMVWWTGRRVDEGIMTDASPKPLG